MNRRSLLAALPAAAILPGLRSVHAQDLNRLKVGVRGGVDEQIFEVVTRVAARDGLTIDAIVITGTVSPNRALADGELHANSFQHIPFLNAENRARGYRIVPIGDTYISPVAIYSRKHRSLEALPQAARIGIPEDVSNQTRALILLSAKGLITLRSGIDIFKDTVTLADVASNPRQFRLIEVPGLVLARSIVEFDAGIITNNWASQVNLLATRDGIAIEARENNPYVNIIAVREQDRNAPWGPRLVRAYQSEDVRRFIAEQFQGSVLPAF
nr:MetQ/NlpA family ABC transporter substrate-binding protein [uncultured Roseococcus sp.]